MRTYELLYIVPASLTDEEAGTVESAVQALIQKYGGTPKESRRLGKFRFAYLIKRTRHGHYVLVYFDAEPDAIAKINEALRIHEGVLRHLILQAEEAGGDAFELVQFQEVVVEGGPRDDRAKKRRTAEREKQKTTESAAEDIKAAAELDESEEKKSEEPKEEVKSEAVEKETADAPEEKAPEAVPVLSAEELDKKIDAALEDTKA